MMRFYNIKTGLICMLTVLSLGCKKEFLNITPNHYLTESDFYKTEEDFVQATNAVYADLQNFTLDAHFFQEGRSDNTTYDDHLDQGSLGGNRQFGFMDQFEMTSNATIISDAWSEIFDGVKDCNVPLAYLQNAKIDATVSARLQGELRFLRAYFYFAAVRYWGDVPLILDPMTSAEQAFAITRSPLDSVYDAIIADAGYAATALPASYKGSDVGRATRGAAEMLLAEVYMTRHQYSDCEKELRLITGSSEYSLLASYADVFDPANKNNAESIFEVQFKDGSSGEASNFIYQFAPVGSPKSLLPGPAIGSGRNLPTKDMIAAYEPNDLRKDVSVGYVTRGGVNVYYVKKYAHATDPTYAGTPDDWPVYRYAGALLLLAEAINEQGYQTGEPFTLLNQIRTRAGLPALKPSDLPDQQSFRDAVLHERRIELAFENHRWFDLLRTGTAIAVMTAYGKSEIADPTTPPPDFLPLNENSFQVTKDKLLFPIPSDELNKDPHLTQNPGY